MTRARFVGVILGLAVLGSLMPATAPAQSVSDKRTYFTFSQPVTLPGVTLQAGRYLFRLADADTGRKVIHVLSADGKTPYALLFSIPQQRLEPSGTPEVRFMETAKGMAAAVKTWWYPGERTGYEFIYPKVQARLLTRGTSESVLTTREETTKPEQTQSAELERFTPSGQEVAITTQQAPSEPTGVSQAGTIATGPTSTAAASVAPSTAPSAGIGQAGTAPSLMARADTGARTELPKTGSNLPLVGLLGLFALAGAVVLRFAAVPRR